MPFSNENTTVPIKLTNPLLKSLYNRLCTKCEYQKLNEVNRDKGCYNESHDYVQETLITLLNKTNNNEVQFFSSKALWAWCNNTLNMLLMRYHRDYTIVKSRTAILVDYDGETQGGLKNENKISAEHCKGSSLPEVNYQDKEFKEYILAYSFMTAEIIHINKLYSVDTSCTLISLSQVIEMISNFGIKRGLRALRIHKYTQPIIIDAITSFCTEMGIELKLPEKNTIETNRVLGSREIDLLSKVRVQSQKNTSIGMDELVECLNNNLNL